MDDDALPPGGEPVVEVDVDASWDAWTPQDIAARLAGAADLAWAVAGGWAVDLFLGRATREHEDLEIVVPGDEFGVVRAVLEPELTFWVVGAGHRWPGDDAAALAALHQTWGATADGLYRIDVFRDLGDRRTWVSRRDPALARPWPDVVRRDAEGIPYLAPEVVLHYKAKLTRDKDEADFEALLPELDAAARTWLRQALEHLHPDHPWLTRV